MFKLFKRLRLIFKVKRFLPFLFDFFVSSDVALSKKLLSIGAIVSYTLLPLDLIPDFFSYIGILDDVAILMLVLQQIIKIAPYHLRAKHKLIDD